MVSGPPHPSLLFLFRLSGLSGWHEFTQHNIECDHCSVWHVRKKINWITRTSIQTFLSLPPKKWCWYPFHFSRNDSHIHHVLGMVQLVIYLPGWFATQYPNQINFEKVSRCIKATVQIRVCPSIFLSSLDQLILFGKWFENFQLNTVKLWNSSL